MKEVYEGIVSFLKNYQERTHVKGYVLGISEGKDSTVVAKLLVDSIGKENVLGVLMPNGKQADIEDSYTVCDFLDINYTVVNIENAFDELIHQIDVSKITTVEGNEENIPVTEKALTNVPPRIRMTILYTIAQSVGYRVAGTSNASELFKDQITINFVYRSYLTRHGKGPVGDSVFKEIQNPYETNRNNLFQGEFWTYEFNEELVLYGINHVQSKFKGWYPTRAIETCCDICEGHTLATLCSYSVKTYKHNFSSICK